MHAMLPPEVTYEAGAIAEGSGGVAAAAGELQVCESLVVNIGVYPKPTFKGLTPEDMARFRGHAEVVKFFQSCPGSFATISASPMAVMDSVRWKGPD